MILHNVKYLRFRYDIQVGPKPLAYFSSNNHADTGITCQFDPAGYIVLTRTIDDILTHQVLVPLYHILQFELEEPQHLPKTKKPTPTPSKKVSNGRSSTTLNTKKNIRNKTKPQLVRAIVS